VNYDFLNQPKQNWVNRNRCKVTSLAKISDFGSKVDKALNHCEGTVPHAIVQLNTIFTKCTKYDWKNQHDYLLQVMFVLLNVACPRGLTPTEEMSSAVTDSQA
jgi:hypothetical protein